MPGGREGVGGQGVGLMGGAARDSLQLLSKRGVVAVGHVTLPSMECP